MEKLLGLILALAGIVVLTPILIGLGAALLAVVYAVLVACLMNGEIILAIAFVIALAILLKA